MASNACQRGGGGSIDVESTSTSQAHSGKPAKGESDALTVQLVDVPGYRYVDPPKSEIQHVLDLLAPMTEGDSPEAPRAISLHGVVADDASQNTAHNNLNRHEVGYLQLIEFHLPLPTGLEEQAASMMAGIDEISDEFSVDGTTEIGRANV